MKPSNLTYVRQALLATAQMDKVASAAPQLAYGARSTAAAAASELVEHFKTAAANSSALGIVDYVLSLRDLAAKDSDVKLSADKATLEDAIEKLAVALVVDESLSSMIAGTNDLVSKEAMHQQRFLGREYIASLTRLLIE
jgi:hypothetical protein